MAKIIIKELRLEDTKKKRVFVSMALCDEMGIPGLPLGRLIFGLKELHKKYPNYKVMKVAQKDTPTNVWDILDMIIEK